jgi:hypothetical protein
VKTSEPVAEPDQALKTLRIIWVMVTFGVVVTGAVVAAITMNQPDPGPVTLGPVRVGSVALMLLIGLMAIGYFIRLQTYKAGWVQDRVKPASYVTGNIILFAMIEGAAIVSIILGGFIGDRFACFAIATAGLVGLLLNFPNGGPMRASEPRF